jgi:hypothetical protein
MSDSKPREIYVLTVDKEYYAKHIEIFKAPNTTVKSVFVEGENHEGDEMHKRLLKNYLKAQKELRDWEFNKRHKQF